MKKTGYYIEGAERKSNRGRQSGLVLTDEGPN
jgi:hypothetical protein